MDHLLALLEQYGLSIVFLNVLVEQLGAPIPAYPTLVITGALAERGDYSAGGLLATAVAAALVADLAWYFAGRRYGRTVLATLCRISLSPDSCVNQTESVYLRWGARSLLIAKFVPGFASIASALAGAVGTRTPLFLLFDSLGAALWAGSAIFLGTLFSAAVDEVLAVLVELGKWGGLLLVLAFTAFIATKWWQRQRFIKSLQMARISVEELGELLARDEPPVILDVRSAFVAEHSGRIPGATVTSLEGLDAMTLEIPASGEVIVYCACPNEASAARVAKALMQRGYRRVRPLAGGIDAWIAAGHATVQ